MSTSSERTPPASDTHGHQLAHNAIRTSRAFGLAISILVLVALTPLAAAGASGYGPGIGADSLANMRVGGPHATQVSYRFRATQSARLESITVYIVTGSGYSDGDRGDLRITVRGDDGSARHRPSGEALASKTVSSPSAGAGRVYRFSSPPMLSAGTLYHIVFTNADPYPRSNFVSVNSLYVFGNPNANQPARPRQGWAMLTRHGGGSWQDSDGPGSGTYTPILGLRYANGASAGMGYMEVWVRSLEDISNTQKVRQVFTVRGPDRLISTISIRAKRTKGKGALRYALKRGDGSVVDRGSIPASKIRWSSSSTTRGSEWATVKLTSKRRLKSGKSYQVIFKTTRADTVYSVFAIREGASYNYPRSTYFGQGKAQVSTASGWRAFEAWGSPNPEGDLQLYLR